MGWASCASLALVREDTAVVASRSVATDASKDG
jgi:hypothetical protein